MAGCMEHLEEIKNGRRILFRKVNKKKTLEDMGINGIVTSKVDFKENLGFILWLALLISSTIFKILFLSTAGNVLTYRRLLASEEPRFLEIRISLVVS
jgi:hypothetical protein